MPTGIDVGARTIRVATPDGTTRRGNALGRTSDGAPEGALTVGVDDEVYVVGDAADEDGDGTTVGRLFGDDATPDPVRRAAVEAFLETFADAADAGALGHVSLAGETEPLAAVATAMGYDVAAVDPGMAVCYDVLEMPATGLGIAVGEERAVATLATAGVPVATASVDLTGDWYDLDWAATDGLAGRWHARQYETLCGDLADGLVTTAPALEEPVPVAVGGEAVPDGGADGLTGALDGALPFEVASVTVADDPDAALVRGALVAAGADDGTRPPLPPFGVAVPFAGGLADFPAATGALDTAATPPAATDGPAGPAGDGGMATTGDGDVDGVVARTRKDLATLDRRGAMTARGVSELVDRVDGNGGAGGAGVEELRADLDSLAERVPEDDALASLERDFADELDALRETVRTVESELDRIDEETASASAVADLEASLESLDEAVTELESDTEKIRAVLAGLDEDADLGGASLSDEGAETLAADALQDDIDDLASDVSDRIEGVWETVDDLEGRLVDVEATAGDVPDLESTVESVRNAVADVEDETADLGETVDDLGEAFERHRESAPAADDLAAIETDIERLNEDVASLRAEFEETERVDPDTVAAIETDLDGLRQTLITRADRLKAVEESTETLRERIETVYQNSAKSEALSSLEAEAARVRKTAAQAMERTNEMTETVSELGESVDDHEEQLGMLSTNVDNLAGSSVTRSEMDARVDRVDDRVDELERDLRAELGEIRSLADEGGDVEPVEETGPESLVVTLQAGAFVGIGLVGAVLSVLAGYPLVAGGFLVFSIVPGVLSWLVS